MKICVNLILDSLTYVQYAINNGVMVQWFNSAWIWVFFSRAQCFYFRMHNKFVNIIVIPFMFCLVEVPQFSHAREALENVDGIKPWLLNIPESIRNPNSSNCILTEFTFDRLSAKSNFFLILSPYLRCKSFILEYKCVKFTLNRYHLWCE